MQKTPQIREPGQEHIDKTAPRGYFDGATQEEPIVSGVGAVLYLNEDHLFRLKWGLGVGTNNRAKFLALYMLLIFAYEKGVQGIQFFGDSMIIINWINHAQRCHNIYLTPIMEEVSQLKTIFNRISFTHIYRERNSEADRCSKEAAGILQPSSKIEEIGPHGAYSFYHRAFMEAPLLAAA